MTGKHAVALVIALALLIAGCGSTRTITKTTTVVRTQQVQAPATTTTHAAGTTATKPRAVPTAPAPPATGRYGSQYPASFRASFVGGCEHNGGTTKQCTCTLDHLMAGEPYTVVANSVDELRSGKLPSFYETAAKSCI